MTFFSQAARSADLRDRERIERAKEGKGVDRGALRLQKNAQFHDRLVRASLDVKPRQAVTDVLMALTVACPEVLLQQSYRLGWGPAREQPEAGNGPPTLLARYQRELDANDFSFANSGAIESDIAPKGLIREVLLCHGLSPTPDTVLLLADIGRAARISHAMGLGDVHVMLADVSWMRHNRSVLGHFTDEDEYSNQLRVCQDNRRRIYKALKLRCDVFSISAHQGSTSISRPSLQSAGALYRELAVALWGERALGPHDVETKALIGQSFNGMKPRNVALLPTQIQALLKFPECASGLENSLRGELKILRSLSELFSSFDGDIFVYYFAQFFAQNSYKQFLKVAVCSEFKFDSYFDRNYEHFVRFAAEDASAKAPVRGRRNRETKLPLRRYVYLPQYQLGEFELLPYSSLSLDVMKSEEPLDGIFKRLILLKDCGDRGARLHLEKIAKVLSLTPLAARNRLVSDLLSFAHLLVTRVRAEANPDANLSKAIYNLGKGIALDIYSAEYGMADYPLHFSDWLKASDKEDSVLPFHLKPYTWDDERWSDGTLETAATFVFELLMSMRRICE
jgi:hypothetical protein